MVEATDTNDPNLSDAESQNIGQQAEVNCLEENNLPDSLASTSVVETRTSERASESVANAASENAAKSVVESDISEEGSESVANAASENAAKSVVESDISEKGSESVAENAASENAAKSVVESDISEKGSEPFVENDASKNASVFIVEEDLSGELLKSGVRNTLKSVVGSDISKEGSESVAENAASESAAKSVVESDISEKGSEPFVENDASKNASVFIVEEDLSGELLKSGVRNTLKSVVVTGDLQNTSEAVVKKKVLEEVSKSVQWDLCESEEEDCLDKPEHIEYYIRNKNPSLMMRMRDHEFETSVECVSMGRGYINMEKGKSRYRMANKTFSCQSTDWRDDLMEMAYCSTCGAITPANMRDGSQIYCSTECVALARMRENGVVETSIFDVFYPGETGTATIRKKVVDGRAPCNVILQSRLSVYRQRKFPRQPRKLLRAKTGDDVLVEGETKKFLRGVVVDVNNSVYKVGLIDYSEVVEVRAVYATTKNLKKIMSFGGIISFIGNETPRSKLVKYRVKERKAFGVWLCEVFESDKKDVTEIMLEEWIPPFKMYAEPLPSGSTVVITRYLDAKTMYVRKVNGPRKEDYARYVNDIAVHCIEAKKYKTMPSIGEICCARYAKDGSYYRGVVRGIENGLVEIFFEDSGTEQLTDISDLRYLPALAKQVRSFSTLVTLKDVTLLSTPGAIGYLNRLTAYSCELVIKCEENSTTDVILTDRYSGEIVNEKICSFEVPTWKKSRHPFSKTGEVLDYTAIQMVSLACGELNDIYVLNFSATNFRKLGIFWGTLSRSEYLGHLEGELKDRMTEYCSYLENDRYLPRRGELCIAKLKGEWRRAVCLGDKDVVCKLTFIDSGVSLWVETKYIRKILKEFLEMPALALKCAVSGFNNMADDEKENMIAYLKRMNRKTIRGVKVLTRSQGIYYLSLTIPPDFDLTRPLSPGGNVDSDSNDSRAAVVVTFPENITYETAMAGIESRIDFDALEIDDRKSRKLGDSQLALEFCGNTCVEDTKLLFEELTSAFGDKGYKVGCMMNGRLRIESIEKSVTKEEITQKLAELGNCDKDEIRITTLIETKGFQTAWVKCPLISALDIAEKGNLVLGNSPAKYELELRRPLCCFRCLREGHIGAHCPSQVENTKCFRCSKMGHITANCDKRPHCSVCSLAGLPSLHTFGSSSCPRRKNITTDPNVAEILKKFSDY